MVRSEKSINYIDQLTWLRGIAAFFVIVSHTVRATEVSYHALDQVSILGIFKFFDLGSYGVVLFFALSGCTLFISNGKKVSTNEVWGFYVKRFFRIWPAFFISLLLYAFFRIIFQYFYIEPQGFWIEKQFLKEFDLSGVVAYLTFTFNITGPGGLFNNAYWSLPVEFQYYILFPVIVASLRYKYIGPVAIGAFLYFCPKLGLNFMIQEDFYSLGFTFCGGVLVGYIYEIRHYKMSGLIGFALLLLFTILVSLISNNYINLPDFPIISGKWNWYGIIGILSVFVVLNSDYRLPTKYTRFLQYYGTISYSTYLYHNLFIAMATLMLVGFDIHDGILRLLFTFLFTLILTYSAAKASYNYVEKPSISLGRRILGRNS